MQKKTPSESSSKSPLPLWYQLLTQLCCRPGIEPPAGGLSASRQNTQRFYWVWKTPVLYITVEQRASQRGRRESKEGGGETSGVA